MNMKGRIINELQCLGVRLNHGKGNRKGGAGPAEGICILIGDVAANVPCGAAYVKRSPYEIRELCGRQTLFKNRKEVAAVRYVPAAGFYDCYTKDDIRMKKIALLHGKDCLASTVIQKCVYWNSENRCKFCGIELSLQGGATLALKTPLQLAETAKKAKETDKIKHIVLTNGAVKPSRRGIEYIADCVRGIKKNVNIPVHVQIEPPEDVEELEELKSAGLDTIGLHIESFDMDILSKIAPVKSAFGLKRYEKAWKKAVRLFGTNQVSTFLIAGLGERMESIVEAAKFLGNAGVYPFLVPFRPIPGTKMEGKTPPNPDSMLSLYEKVSEINKQYGMYSRQSRAGCVRCGACSALGEFERWAT